MNSYKNLTIKTPISEIFAAQGVHFSTNSTHLIMEKCYNCGKNKKLYVNAELGLFNCFSCGEKGGPVKIVAKMVNCGFKQASIMLYGKQAAQSIYEDDTENFDVQITGVKKRKQSSSAVVPVKITKPPYMVPLKPSDVDAWNYLLGRGLTPEIIKELNFYHWESAKRVVLPVTIDGELYGTLSRDYIGDQERKVLNSKGQWRSFTVWNFDLARESDELVICEGAFSAIKCGIFRSIALLGKVATEGQIEVIRSMMAKKLYICLDVGTDSDQVKIFSQLAPYYPNAIYQVVLPPLKLIKCPNCKKKTEYLNGPDNEDTQFNCICGKIYKNKEFFTLLKNSEYKDSGDYTFEEMEVFIKNAKVYRTDPTMWI
jgi:hypothetical protein